MTDQPNLSVIIADVNGPPMIMNTLEAIAHQRVDGSVEVVVASATGDSTVEAIRERFPTVKVLPHARGTTIPRLRAAALAESTGALVAVIEDHCDVGPGWVEQVVRAHEEHPECIAVGGGVENGNRERLMDWAVYFAEYSAFMGPIANGIVDDVPGNNVCYKRAAFEGLAPDDPILTQGFWESTLHPRLLERGEQFFSVPSMVVYHRKYFGVAYGLSQRFQYSRYYAGTLYSTESIMGRLYRAAVSVALPALLLARIERSVLRKKRNLKQLAMTTPMLAVIATVWAAGELVGTLFGPGKSLSRIE